MKRENRTLCTRKEKEKKGNPNTNYKNKKINETGEQIRTFSKHFNT